jgi:hypothetical protein
LLNGDPTLAPVVLSRDDDEVLVQGLRVSRLADFERRRLLRLADVVQETSAGTTIRRNRRLIVGRSAADGYTVVVPPPMSSEHFVALVVFALGGDLSGVFRHTASPTSRTPGEESPDEFLRILAALCVQEAESIVRRHIAKSYIDVVRREALVRGRPLWAPDFGRHPVEGLTCRVQELSTDNLYNRLVLAGLQVARRMLDRSAFQERANNQVFIWRSLAEPAPVRLDEFERAHRRTNRLTSHYCPALALSHALVSGCGPADLFDGTGMPAPHFEFSLPDLFEQVLARLLRPLAQRFGAEVRFKEKDRDALVDGAGRTYREVEPDISIWLAGKPVAVLDAKFKPRYMEALPDGTVATSSRVTNEDIYQLLFYQSRLQRAYATATAPSAWIVAPRIGAPTPPCMDATTIRWCAEGGEEETRLRVEGIDLDVLTNVLLEGRVDYALVEAAPGLARDLTPVLAGRHPLLGSPRTLNPATGGVVDGAAVLAG